jgi:nicotinamidase/pyrazinamidase
VIEVHGRAQTLWPDHCVAGTHGADLTPALSFERARAIVRKGTETEVDSYSAFRNNFGKDGERAPTGLGGYLKECGIRDVYVCGLARDFCVSWTAQDAVDLGFSTTVIWDLTRAVEASSNADVERGLRAKGVAILDSAALC